jgi:hypothetical protein
MIEVIRDINFLSDKLSIDIPDFPPFYLPEYYKDQNIEVVFFVEKAIVIPLSFSKNYFLKNAQFLFPPLYKNKRLNETEERDFLNHVIQYLSEHQLADRILPPQTYCIFKAFPDNSVACPFGTYYLDMSLSIDELWLKMHSKHRNVIRNAEKKGCELKIGMEQIDVFYELYVSTMKRASLSYYPITYFLSLKNNMKNSNLICVVAYFDNKPQGALLIPYSHYGAYYIYGSSAESIELTGVNNYMHWEVIKLLKKDGVLRYDFVGARLSDIKNSKLHGVQMFKERFGSILESGYLWKMDLTLRCKFYDCLVYLKAKILFRKNVYKDIIDQELSKMK